MKPFVKTLSSRMESSSKGRLGQASNSVTVNLGDRSSLGPGLELSDTQGKLNLFPWDDRLSIVSKLPSSNTSLRRGAAVGDDASFTGSGSKGSVSGNFGQIGGGFGGGFDGHSGFDFSNFRNSILDRQFRKLFRTVDGSHNNQRQTKWGATHTGLIRLTRADYADGISDPRGGFKSVLPSARAVSNAVAAQGSQSIPNAFNLSDMFWQWGQFIDHDMDISETAFPFESFNVKVPKGDRHFDPRGTGTKQIGLNRTIYDENTGTSKRNPRQQINEITAFLDGSMVYGSDAERAAALRTNDGTGKLKVTRAKNGETLMPLNTLGLPNAGGNGSNLFLAGDVRANEQVGLTSIHTLFVREHNRLVDELQQRLDKSEFGVWKFYVDSQQVGMSKGDFLYQAAKRIVGAQIQSITYNEFLPILVGKNALPKYKGYQSGVDPSISNEFSTAAFRFGHTMLSPQILRVGQDGATEKIRLRNAFFNPGTVKQKGVDSLLRGLTTQTAQELDNQLVDDVRNFLFGPPGSGGFDLASLNIQRGRDHGLPGYVEARKSLGEGTVKNVSQITSDKAVQDQLTGAYKGLNEIDLWVGGLAEDAAPGAVVGRTFQDIIVDQFTRLRDGDRFWYQNDKYIRNLAPDVGSRSLSEIIKDNTSIGSLQDNVFLVAGGSNPLG